MDNPDLNPLTLAGKSVRLEPLTMAHHADLCAVGFDPALWKFLRTVINDAAQMQTFIETAMRQPSAIPFATIDIASGKAVGSTRFFDISRNDRRAEIGSTWIGIDWQRTHINTEAKYLMLRQAFEVWKLMRVEFTTDVLNIKSRDAILRLGATQEGIFRKHMIMDDGRIRDSVRFAIIDEDWPTIRDKLAEKVRAAPNV